MNCGFAYPGTYGHECGKPAHKVGLKKSNMTKSGIFYSGRCEECAKIKGGENSDIYAWQPVEPDNQRNEFKC